MNKIILAVLAVAVSAGAVNAIELERMSVADIAKMEGLASPKPAPAAVKKLTADQERQWDQWLQVNIVEVKAMIWEARFALKNGDTGRLSEIQKETAKIQEKSSRHEDANFDRFEAVCQKFIADIRRDFSFRRLESAGLIKELDALDAEINAKLSARPLAQADLDAAEIAAVKAVFNRVGVKVVAENADCSGSQAVLESSSRGFTPAAGVIFHNGRGTALTGEELTAVAALFTRLGVAAELHNGIDLSSRVTVTSRACGVSPARWTASYIKAK